VSYASLAPWGRTDTQFGAQLSQGAVFPQRGGGPLFTLNQRIPFTPLDGLSGALSPLLAPIEVEVRASVRDEVLSTFKQYLLPVGVVITGIAVYALVRTFKRR
jgi:hypothetical protein